MRGVALSKGPEGILGRKDLVFIAFGQCVGSGVITLIGAAQLVTGYSTWLAYAAAIIVGFFCAFPYMIMSATLRFGGGTYSAYYATLGDRLAGMYLLSRIPASVNSASYCIACGTYAVSLFSGANPKVVALAFLLVFFLINLRGIKVFSKVQNIMGYALIAGLLCFVIFGMFKVDFGSVFNMSSPEFFLGGSSGFVSAVFLLVYSTQGYWFALGFGKQAKNARKDIPFAMLISVPMITILYIGCAIVGSGVLPLSEVAGKPLTLAAKTALPTPLFWAFMIGGVMMALCTSLNSTIAFNTNVLLQGCEDGWLPKVLSKKNRWGVPYLIVIIICAVGTIPIFTGFSISKVTNNILLLTHTLTVIFHASVFLLPTKYPEAWANRTFRIPTGLFYVVMVLSFTAECGVVWNSVKGVGPVTAIVSFGALTFCVVYALLRKKAGKVDCAPQVWSD